ncbi:serine hydrolase domain-containing protein [Microbulbifer mangrovi]|uniref:serine hydrolase domain-containing protein n=1 Tax=Microbulbifer mangrovi TaxID=927787 RepID=UPI00130128A1|nr:serine hydrolase domain-containing protein [Microbulbifer mangrovi]
MQKITSLVMVLLSLITFNLGAAEVSSTSDRTYAELAGEIEQILKRTRTPGAAVAVFEPDGSVWRYTTGFKNIEHREMVDRHTVFRVGSVSKMLVGLAVMKLVSEKKLSLGDRVADLAPEVAFENPWKDQYPIRLVHLLNHTTGWDAPHPPELVSQNKEPLTITETLALHPHSRTSRWVPGSRSAYNNSGPLVAAYIVEKITGERYEDYIESRFFQPLAMEDSGYYFDDHFRSNAATLYRGGQALPYWHLPNRAAGGMHSSLDDMVRLVRFMQHPQKAVETKVLDSDSIRAMQQPVGSHAAAAGMEIGWGTGLTSFHHKGLIYYGHEGALPGVRALVAYTPQGEQGHVVLTNGESPAANQIHKVLAEYEATKQISDKANPARSTGKPDAGLGGFYQLVSPNAERWRIAHKLIPWKIDATEGGIRVTPLIGGKPRILSATTNGKYLQEDTGRVALVAAEDPLLGSVLHYGPMTLKKTGTFTALLPLLLVTTWLVTTILGLLFLLIWLPSKLLGRNMAVADVRLRIWSVLPVSGIFLAVTGAVMVSRGPQPFALAATKTIPSLMVFIGPIVFLLTAFWALRIGYLNRQQATGGFWRNHAILLMGLNAALACFLTGYGIVGLRLWA